MKKRIASNAKGVPSAVHRSSLRWAILPQTPPLVITQAARYTTLALAPPSQWRKWRTPVVTSAIPVLSATSITSESLFDPPG